MLQYRLSWSGWLLSYTTCSAQELLGWFPPIDAQSAEDDVYTCIHTHTLLYYYYGLMLARAPASLAQGLHHYGPRYLNFPSFCTMCGLEKLGLVDYNWLERDLSAMLLRTLAVCRRQESESIKVALDIELRRVDEPFRHWSVPLLVKCRTTCLRVTLRELETFCITVDDSVGWAAHQTVFSVAALHKKTPDSRNCSSYPKTSSWRR